MFALLQQAGSQVPWWLQIIVAVLAAFQSAFIIVGIFAAYWRFIKEKPHTFRLQPTVSGTAEVQEETVFLVIKATAHNAGQVAVPLNLESTGLRIETRRPGDEEWRLFRTHDMFLFLEDSPIRPDVKIEDQVWVEVPYEGRVGVRLELSIFAQDENCPAWTTASIVSLVTKQGAISSENG